MTKNVAYFLLAVSFLAMMWFIVKQAKQNRNVSVEDHKPRLPGMTNCPVEQKILNNLLNLMMML